MKLKNLTVQDVSIRDLGELTVPASGELDVGFIYSDMTALTASASLKTLIEQDKLIVNDDIRDLSKTESLEILSLKTEVEPYNPEEFVYTVQANILNSIFYAHSETVLLEENLKNTFADTFQSIEKVSSSYQVQFDGKACFLGTGTASTQTDSFDSVANWTADAGYATIALETTIKHEGTGSGKLTILDATSKTTWKGALRTYSSNQDWTSYGAITVWIYGQGVGERARLKLTTSGGANYLTNYYILSSGWQQVNFDISSVTRNAIKKIRIEIVKNVTGDLITYWDDMRLVPTTVVYYTSGYVISNVVTTQANIRYMYVLDLDDLPEGTSYVKKISLDGGSHWHTLVDGDEETWLDVTQWAEYSSFSNLKNIQVRFDLATTNTAVTPMIDDYAIMWKLDV